MGVRARLVHSPIKSIVCARNRDIDDNVVEGNTFHDHSIMTGIAMLYFVSDAGNVPKWQGPCSGPCQEWKLESIPAVKLIVKAACKSHTDKVARTQHPHDKGCSHQMTIAFPSG